MSELLLTGKLVKILDKESGTSKAGKDWESKSIVIDTGDQYNSEVCIKFFGKNMSKLNGINLNAQVEVGFNVSSREHNGRYYSSIDGWKIRMIEGNSATNEKIEKLKDEMDLAPTGEDDDLPF